MFGKKHKLDNYIDFQREGYGLWEVWYDNGPGTSAVKDALGLNPFLTVENAKSHAISMAEKFPDRRTKVVGRV